MIPPCTARDEEVVKYQTHQLLPPNHWGFTCHDPIRCPSAVRGPPSDGTLHVKGGDL